MVSKFWFSLGEGARGFLKLVTLINPNWGRLNNTIMKSKKVVKAKIASIGKVVEVYKHAKSDGWVNAEDCRTIYPGDDVQVLKQ